MTKKYSLKRGITRRNFLRNTTLSGAGLLILRSSRSAFAYDANNKLNVAVIGAGGRGRSDLMDLDKKAANLVALCDVDQARAAKSFAEYPEAKPYQDFRRMLDEQGKNIDAVIVATPDHTHAVAAACAMKHGKHVYCEKPLTRTVHEARVLRDLARKHQVVTQMGNQGSASDGLRRAVELVWSGTIGEIQEAHLWFPSGNEPVKRPAEPPPAPSTLDWDLWLGPAPQRPYSPAYAPEKWRAWRAFGSGMIGDFGCHTGNILFRALKLDQLWNFTAGQQPKHLVIRLKTEASDHNEEGYPHAMTSVIELPARGEMPPVQLTVRTSTRPSADLMLGHAQGEWGDLLVGSKGSLYSSNPWNTDFVLLPEKAFAEIKHGPPQILPHGGDHINEWVRACKGNGAAFSSFEIGGPLTELMQLINLSTLVEGTLEYDTVTGRILNSAPARHLLHRPYRHGWSI